MSQMKGPLHASDGVVNGNSLKIEPFGPARLGRLTTVANHLHCWWATRSLALQFLIVGGFCLIAVMWIVGLWVTSQIRDGVITNAASTTALYVDSVISPLLPDMRRSEELTDGVKQALDETLDQGVLGKRLASFKLWRRDGKILYATDSTLIGRVYAPGKNLLGAFGGSVAAEFNNLDATERQEQTEATSPMLEVYSPIREPW